jgi:hypothetical protein
LPHCSAQAWSFICRNITFTSVMRSFVPHGKMPLEKPSLFGCDLIARKQLVGANKLTLLCVGIVARHSSRRRILTLLCVRVVLERFAGTG